jgi:hypothetical protein
MAVEIWLGPSGAEVLLPPVNWMSGSPGEYGQSYKKNYDSATMLDGRIRYNFKSESQRSWTLEWAMLTKENIDILQGLADLRQTLRFNHGMTATLTWRNVAIKSFLPAVLPATFRTGWVSKYKASMTLEESNG